MEEQKERRYIDRKTWPEAVVFYRRNTRVNFIRPFQGPVRLIDISKSAMRVRAELAFARNTDLQLKICIPGNPAIFLKGRVSSIDHENQHSIIHVLPFGYGDGYNSFHAKSILELMLNENFNNSLPLAKSNY